MGLYFAPFEPPGYLTAVLFLSVFCSLFAYFLTSYAITRLAVARVTVFSNLTTAVSVFAGAILLHEPLSGIGVLCSIMVLVGIIGVQRGSD